MSGMWAEGVWEEKIKETAIETYSHSTTTTPSSRYIVLLALLAVVIASAVFWVFAPKENQTVWRSTVTLTLAMMFLMWAITYLAQLHPLVVPRRSDLRPEFSD